MTSITLAVHCDVLLTDKPYAVKSSQMIIHVSMEEIFVSKCFTLHIGRDDVCRENL
jgi:hypothetical protein